MPAPKALLSRLMALDRAENLTRPGDRLLVAVSGGADSVCLAHHLSRLSQRRRLDLTIIHMHHGLRGRGAERDAAFVKRLAGRLGLPFILEELPVLAAAKKERRSLEDAGRRLRYRALAAAAKRGRMDKVAVGHHLDDQAETFLLHLLRGTKAKGLGAMAPKRRLREAGGRSRVSLIRPLLALSRAEIKRYLKAYGLRHRTDPSNRSERFTRNWVRRKVIPLLARRNPRIREHLHAIAADVRRSLRPPSV